MGLFDVDKSNGDRSRPSINSHDKITSGAFMARGTMSTNYITSAPNTNGLTTVQLGTLTLVQTASVLLVNGGANITTNTSTHGLGYAPYLVAALNEVTITGVSNPVNIMLPTFLNASIGGVTSGAVTFGSYLFGFVDQYNTYFQLFNATGIPVSMLITFYLYRQPAAR